MTSKKQKNGSDQIIEKPDASETETHEVMQTEKDQVIIEINESDDSAAEAVDSAAVDESDDSAAEALNAADQQTNTANEEPNTTDRVTVFEEISYPLGLDEKKFWETPWSLHKEGIFKSVYKQSLKEAVQNVVSIFHHGFSHLFLFAGYYFAAFFFDNDENKMASKDRYKDVSVNDLARKLGGIWSRQLITDCLKAAFVDMQLRNNDHHFGNLTFDHLRQLARLKSQKDRFKFGGEADQAKLNPHDLRDKIDLKLGKKQTLSEDKRILQAVARPFKDLNRMLANPQVIEILADKERLGDALTTKEAGELLENCKKFGEEQPLAETVENLTKTLVEVQFEKLTAIKLK